jgi:hypothetical protein
MNASDHERARDLVLQRDIEGVSAGDAVWLDSHLAECSECAVFAEDLQLATDSLRSMPVTASSSLVGATQARVRQHAAELRDREARLFLIGTSFCLGLLWSAGSMFIGWRLSAWLAERLHIAPWAIAAGLVIFWLAPAVVVAIAVLPRYPISYRSRADWLARIEETLQ